VKVTLLKGIEQMETHSVDEAVELEKKSPSQRLAGKGSWSNKSLQGTFVGNATGTIPATFIGGNGLPDRDPDISLPITMWFQYTFDGKGNIDPAFGEATIDGKPSSLIKASGTYSIDPETGIGMETINLPNRVTLNRRFSLSNDNTQLHWVSVDPGFQFQGIMNKQ
jgi:hypothetical protein